MERKYKYLFGPVPSRRYGLSLGVDLTPTKTCDYNCLYCQLDATTRHTIQRRQWVPTADVLDELRHWTASGAQADIITLAGSGEPTLHVDFGKILQAIRRETNLPAALLTNGSLLCSSETRRAAAHASLVKVTLSAPDEPTWRRLHRPAPGLDFAQTIEGIRAFRDEFDGDLRLEIMIVEGVNDTEEQIRQLARIAASIRPDRVEINTPIRPPTDSAARALSPDRLERFAQLFDPPAQTIGRFSDAKRSTPSTGVGDSDSDILSLISRHPATAADIAAALGLAAARADELLERLRGQGKIEERRQGSETYFTAPEKSANLKIEDE